MQNGQLHAESYEIHRKMSDKSERLLHLLLDQLPPVLREAAVSQTLIFFPLMYSYLNPRFQVVFFCFTVCIIAKAPVFV